jgi:hypothetical protein
MTISTKIEVATSAKVDGFRFVKSANVAVVSVLSERDEPGTSLRTVMQTCIAHFEMFFLGWLRALSTDHVFLSRPQRFGISTMPLAVVAASGEATNWAGYRPTPCALQASRLSERLGHVLPGSQR